MANLAGPCFEGIFRIRKPDEGVSRVVCCNLERYFTDLNFRSNKGKMCRIFPLVEGGDEVCEAFRSAIYSKPMDALKVGVCGNVVTSALVNPLRDGPAGNLGVRK